MMMRYLLICFGLPCWLAVLGCADHSTSTTASRTTNEAVRIAAKAATESGKHLNEYEVPKVYFSSRQRQWTVLYEAKETTPGNHFSIVVDDVTGCTQFFPGM